MKNGKGIKNTTNTITYSIKPLMQLWESTAYIFKGLCYYYSLLIDFLFGNITNIIMYNLLKVTIVFLTVVSFYTTFTGLRENFFDAWTALFVTIGVQGTLLALSLYIPVYQSSIQNKGATKSLNVKKYLIWVPMICCLMVSSFFSYVALSEKVYSKIEKLNQEYEVKELFNDIIITTEKELYNQLSLVESNITNTVNHIRSKCNTIMEQNNITANDMTETQARMKELELSLERNKVKYERSLENYARYQQAVADTVDEQKREINANKAEKELEFITQYEQEQYEYETLKASSESTTVSQDDINSLNGTIQGILATLETIDKYNLYGIDLPYEDAVQEFQNLASKLESINALDIRINYLLDSINHKKDLEKFKIYLNENKSGLIESSNLEDMKKMVYNSPFDTYIVSPEVLKDNKDIVPIDTFSMLEKLFNHERMVNDGINQIEKSIGYLTNNNFSFLAYLSLAMAVFIDALILIQGFSVTKSLNKSTEMEDADKQELIYWLLRKQYTERDPKTNKVVRMKMLDKFLSYCVPNENCTKIYVQVEDIRSNPQISMLVNLLNQLNYLIINEDEKLILDPELMVLYLQRSSMMVDTDYFYLGDQQAPFSYEEKDENRE